MQILFHKNYSKKLKKYDPREPERINSAVFNLPEGDVKRLKSNNALYRLRVGDFRIFFTKEKDLIKVLKIDSQEDAYK